MRAPMRSQPEMPPLRRLCWARASRMRGRLDDPECLPDSLCDRHINRCAAGLLASVEARVNCYVGLSVEQQEDAIDKPDCAPAGNCEAVAAAMPEQVFTGHRVPFKEVPGLVILDAYVKQREALREL